MIKLISMCHPLFKLHPKDHAKLITHLTSRATSLVRTNKFIWTRLLVRIKKVRISLICNRLFLAENQSCTQRVSTKIKVLHKQNKEDLKRETHIFTTQWIFRKRNFRIKIRSRSKTKRKEKRHPKPSIRLKVRANFSMSTSQIKVCCLRRSVQRIAKYSTSNTHSKQIMMLLYIQVCSIVKLRLEKVSRFTRPLTIMKITRVLREVKIQNRNLSQIQNLNPSKRVRLWIQSSRKLSGNSLIKAPAPLAQRELNV